MLLGILVFLGYSYYFSTRPLKEFALSANQNADSQTINTRESNFYSESTSQPLTPTASSVVAKTTVSKQDCQPTETEELFYQKVTESLKPIRITEEYSHGNLVSAGEIHKAFSPRASYPATTIKDLPMITKAYNESPSSDLLEIKNRFEELLERYNKAIFDSKQYYQGIITNLCELVRQCPNSPFQPHYQETINLIIQMQKEDEEFYDKYSISSNIIGAVNPTDVYYRDVYAVNSRPLPLDERINAYIYCLRYSCFYKSNGRYAMDFGDENKTSLGYYKGTILSAGNLIKIGTQPEPIIGKLENGQPIIGVDYTKIPTQNAASAVPAVLNILEDRRPIIAVDEDKIPSRFYRYQDAAVEILQRMFSKAEKPFPIEISQDEYFSEYMEKQKPEVKQKVISDIKAWVEEAMANSPKQEEPPETPK